MDLFSVKSIHSILSRHGFKFSKSLGQNFLTDRTVCERIAELSGLSKEDCVLEIGPGLGSLTCELAKAADKVVSVEIDRALLPVLAETLAEYDNIKVINSDILKCNLSELVREEFGDVRPKVCANLPYYITTPVISHLIDSGLFSSITTMIQKEVADRICAKPNTSDYGAFSVYVQYYTDPEELFFVPAESFEPQPKVNSAVVMMTMRETPRVSPKSEKLFFRVVKASFAQRRKQLVNGLFSAFGKFLSKQEISGILVSCGLSASVRGEALSLEEFCRVSDALFEFVKD